MKLADGVAKVSGCGLVLLGVGWRFWVWAGDSGCGLELSETGVFWVWAGVAGCGVVLVETKNKISLCLFSFISFTPETTPQIDSPQPLYIQPPDPLPNKSLTPEMTM